MISILSGIIAIICYLLGTYFQSGNLSNSLSKANSQHTNQPTNQQSANRPSDARGDARRKVILCGIVASAAHLINVYHIINTPTGYDFSLFKIATLFSWCIVFLVLLSSIKKPLENLFIALFPLAIISIICSLSLNSSTLPHASYTTGVASHILLAILAMSIITIAAFQALFITFQNRMLKQKSSLALISHLPPLQTMESLLFEIVWAGLLMLSGVIITGILFMDDFFGQHLSHKTVLSIISWAVFAALLWGRHQWGWRGNTAMRWTLTGFTFLILAYFGSKFVLELILDNA